jgi:hypothetical protein
MKTSIYKFFQLEELENKQGYIYVLPTIVARTTGEQARTTGEQARVFTCIYVLSTRRTREQARFADRIKCQLQGRYQA